MSIFPSSPTGYSFAPLCFSTLLEADGRFYWYGQDCQSSNYYFCKTVPIVTPISSNSNGCQNVSTNYHEQNIIHTVFFIDMIFCANCKLYILLIFHHFVCRMLICTTANRVML